MALQQGLLQLPPADSVDCSWQRGNDIDPLAGGGLRHTVGSIICSWITVNTRNAYMVAKEHLHGSGWVRRLDGAFLVNDILAIAIRCAKYDN